MNPLDQLTTALSDRYEVAHEIGAGGMATVYLAHDLKHDRDVAITARLNHRHTVAPRATPQPIVPQPLRP